MERPTFIGNYKDFMEPDNSHDQGSEELLSVSCPIGKKLGLKKIGIHIETLLPGRRTSWPHTERDEEELYTYCGKSHVWFDGNIYNPNLKKVNNQK